MFPKNPRRRPQMSCFVRNPNPSVYCKETREYSLLRSSVTVFGSFSSWPCCKTPPSEPQGSPSSKRRGPLLQPIIEGETALFFDDIKVKSCCLNNQSPAPPPPPPSPPPHLTTTLPPSNEPDCCLLIGRLPVSCHQLL